MIKIIKLMRKRRLDAKMNYGKVAEKWLEQKKIKLKESTYATYVYLINYYLMPVFQKMTFKELQEYDFYNFVFELMEKVSNKSVRDILCVLKATLYFANSEYEANINVKHIMSPKLQMENVKVLSNREKGRLESYCLKLNTLKSIGIIICLNTGLRVGEICSLKWENIDLNRRVIYVRSTLQRIYDIKEKKTKIKEGKPKTQKSIRAIPISNKLYEILKTMKKQYEDEAYFLTGKTNKFVEPRNYQDSFKKMLKKCRIKSYKFHTLRHTFATKCVEVGMDIKSLSEILGHSSVQITLDKYVHSNYKIQKKYLEKL